MNQIIWCSYKSTHTDIHFRSIHKHASITTSDEIRDCPKRLYVLDDVPDTEQVETYSRRECIESKDLKKKSLSGLKSLH